MMNDCTSSVTTADGYGAQLVEMGLYERMKQKTVACVEWRENQNGLSIRRQTNGDGGGKSTKCILQDVIFKFYTYTNFSFSETIFLM